MDSLNREQRARLVNRIENPKAKILFIGYSEDKTILINSLTENHCEVWHTDKKIDSTSGYDLVISYGYRHIIKKQVIESSSTPIVNLHISYLPWNRGAHPNFWSFYDCTPSGVSIHLVDEGIDTGPILYQKYVNFTKDETTFSQTYRRLVSEIEQLFIDNLEEIITKKFVPIPQRRLGTFHRQVDLPREFSGWDSEIRGEILRLDNLLQV